MITAECRAVFLSYAREDSEAARRIADALRASGVEVWFDQDELVGGDQWDQKIRGQINACALFIPVISAKTQARQEGYFRLEWKLAEDRSHLMVKGKPFIMPVSIDATSERGALVPDAFRAVQWTNLSAGETPPVFIARVQKLLGANSELEAGRPRPVQYGGAASPPNPHVGRTPSARLAWSAAVAAAFLLGVFGWSQFKPKSGPQQTPSESAERRSAPPTAEKPAAPAGSRLGARSIVVLPFENQSEDKDANAFFADGMHEDVITNLLLIRELRCVPRTTALTYRGAKKSHREIAEELGVAYVLTGTVRRADKKVRITGTLINARTDEPIWSKPYDKDITDAGVIFAIQSELAQAIAGELKATLSPQEKKLVERRPTENTAAYDLFLQARQLRDANFTETKVRKAEALLQAAVALDPRFAIAWSELAYSHGYLYIFNHDTSEERANKARLAIDSALRLAPDEPEVILNHGYYLYYCLRDYARADARFSEVSRRQPNAPAPHHARGSMIRRQGSIATSLVEFRAAAALDPGNIDTAVQVTLMEARARRWEQAIAAQRRLSDLRKMPMEAAEFEFARYAFWSSGSIREMEAVTTTLPDKRPGSARSQKVRFEFASARGDFHAVARLAPAFDPNASSRDNFLGVTALAALGREAEARALLFQAPSLIRARLEREPTNAVLWSTLGMVQAMLGNREDAVRCAQKAVELVPDSFDAIRSASFRSDLAFVYAWTGNKDNALEEYARLLRLPSFEGPVGNAGTTAQLNVHVMRRHPYFFPLQGDPRFEALLNDPKNNAPLF